MPTNKKTIMKNYSLVIFYIILLNSCEDNIKKSEQVETKNIHEVLIAIKENNLEKLKKYMLTKYINNESRFATKVNAASIILNKYGIPSSEHYSSVLSTNIQLPENMVILRVVIYNNLALDEKTNYVYLEFQYYVNISKSKFIDFNYFLRYSPNTPNPNPDPPNFYEKK